MTTGLSSSHRAWTLRPYQVRALERLDLGWAEGRRRAWVVLPPGAGKTLIGLEAARRLGRKTVVLVPNSAIQNQWIDHWERSAPASGTAGSDRSLASDVTVLTYQSLAVFDPDAETDADGHARSLMSRLHDNGHELIARLAAAGPLTLVLDECHHLLDVWGRLLAEVLDQVPDAIVLGLTGTPPESLSPAEKRLVDTLFGAPVLGASIPALVRQGHLAPFAELAWLTPPTAAEAEHIAGEAEHFAELTTGLVTSTDFLTWLDSRFTGDTLSWARLEKDDQRLAAAALRMHHTGLLGLPPGARLREEHRHAPSAEDWVALLDDYIANSSPSADTLDAVKRALPAVGYRLTRRGIRAAQSPVDRVLARSAAKTYATVEITASEADSLGDRLRALILCDHERDGARIPARLLGVLDAEAGSAWLTLRRLVADERTRALGPMMVTGRTVAAGRRTARAFVAWAGRPELSITEDDGVCVISGLWTTRTWVRLVTAFFEEGRCQVLVGTRALLGEGWDARGVNTLIDLTAAATTTSVVQTRGRALRLNPAWPEKVANTWTVVCLTAEHPKGAADWQRFVRKHQGYLAAAPDGEIVSGVAHVDTAFSPYAPPPPATLDAVNAAMLTRAAERESTRVAWRVGTEFRDELVHTVRIRPARTAAPLVVVPAEAERPPEVIPDEACARPAPPAPASPALIGLVLGGGAAALLLSLLSWVALVLGVPALMAGAVLAAGRARAVRRATRLLDEASAEPPLMRFAYVVADALEAIGLSPRGAGGVVARIEPDGSYRLSLADVDTTTSERFALALDELLTPMAAPRYVIPRYVLDPAGPPKARAWLDGTARADGVVYHAVPSVFGQNRSRSAAFAAAWNTWVSGGEPVYTNTPEGEGVLATHRGEDPLSASTVLRVAWD